LGYIFAADIIGIFIQIFVLGSYMYFETQCVMTLQGHARSLILVQSKARVCNFLLVINSNFGSILPRFRDIARFLGRATPRLFSRANKISRTYRRASIFIIQ